MKKLSRVLRWAALNAMRITPAPLDLRVHGLYRRALSAFGPEYLCSTIWGDRMICSNGDYVESHVLQFGQWEPHVTSSMQERLVGKDVFVDVGANIGYHSLLASRLVAEVIAVEPNPSAVDRLERNVRLNSRTNIQIEMAAIASRKGKAELFLPSETNLGAATIVAGRSGRKLGMVQTVPLVDLLGDRTSRVQAIKVDVEGAEFDVLSDLLLNLAAFPRLEMVWAEFSTDESKSLISKFVDQGFSPYLIPAETLRSHMGKYAKQKIVSLAATPKGHCDLLLERRIVS